MNTIPLIAKTDGLKQGPLIFNVDDWQGYAVKASGQNQKFDSVTQLGNASGFSAAGSVNCTVGLLDCFNPTPRMYGAYTGGDSTPTTNWHLDTFLIRIAKGPDNATTDDDGQHGIRQHNHRGSIIGHATLRLNVPVSHPGHGWAGYIQYDEGGYYGAGLTLHENQNRTADEIKSGYVPRALIQWVKGNAPFGAGPLLTHITDAKTIAARLAKGITYAQMSLERTSFQMKNCEWHVGRKYFSLATASDGLISSCKIYAADGATVLDMQKDRVSADGNIRWPGAVAEYTDVKFFAVNGQLMSNNMIKYLKAGQCKAKFNNCYFNNVKVPVWGI